VTDTAARGTGSHSAAHASQPPPETLNATADGDPGATTTEQDVGASRQAPVATLTPGVHLDAALDVVRQDPIHGDARHVAYQSTNRTGRRMAECPPGYLDALAEVLEARSKRWAEDHPDHGQAALARAWANSLRGEGR
jgi:hypothetical protein